MITHTVRLRRRRYRWLEFEESDPVDRACVQGVLFWIGFSVLAVAVRGVRWDETFEHAQALLGATPYPHDHPFYVLQRNAFTINGWLSAFLLWLTGSPLIVCGFRNVAHLAMSIVPVFLITSRLARRALAGHVAVVVLLLGSLSTFASYYPLAVWPNGFSNGAIGQGWALLVFYFTITHRLRIAYAMLGLMPLIHIGQAPLVYLFGLVHAWMLRRENRRIFRRALRWGMTGFAPCILFWVVLQLLLKTPLPQSGPYFSPEAPFPVWQAYSALHDVHGVRPRFAPVSHRNIVLGGLLLLGAVAVLWELFEARTRGPLLWCFVYGALAACVVWSAAILQFFFGPAPSFWLLVWMPHRFSNHAALVLLSLAVALLCRRGRANEEEAIEAAGDSLVAIVLAYAAVLPALAYFVPEGVYQRYLGGAPESIAFALWGGAFAALVRCFPATAHIRPAFWCMYFGALVLLVESHLFGMVCCLLGTLAVGMAYNLRVANTWPRARCVTGLLIATGTRTALLVVVSATLLLQEFHTREHLPVSDFERRVTQYLRERGEDDVMLLAPYWQIYLQAKTGHPVFADYQTAHWMTYIPALAPGLKKMHLDLFGKAIDGPFENNLNEWVTRTPEQWTELGREYGFRYVIAPDHYPLLLPEVLREGGRVLYRIGEPQDRMAPP